MKVPSLTRELVPFLFQSWWLRGGLVAPIHNSKQSMVIESCLSFFQKQQLPLAGVRTTFWIRQKFEAHWPAKRMTKWWCFQLYSSSIFGKSFNYLKSENYVENSGAKQLSSRETRPRPVSWNNMAEQETEKAPLQKRNRIFPVFFTANIAGFLVSRKNMTLN